MKQYITHIRHHTHKKEIDKAVQMSTDQYITHSNRSKRSTLSFLPTTCQPISSVCVIVILSSMLVRLCVLQESLTYFLFAKIIYQN